MTAKTAEQIHKELKALRASKEEIEFKISSLSYDLRIIKDEEQRNQQIFREAWREDVDQLERIDRKIEEVCQYFDEIDLIAFNIVRNRREICLYDTARLIDIEEITYNRNNLDEILDRLEYHKTYAAFYRDIMRGDLTFDKPNYITRLRRQMRFEVRSKDESLGKRMIIATLQTLEDGYVSIVMQLGLSHYRSYYKLALDDTFSYSVESDDTITLSLVSDEVICKIDEVEERLFKLKESMIELYKQREDMINY